MNFISILSVGIGAAFGGVVRYIISESMVTHTGRFPFATFMINILGSFLLGLILAISLRHGMTTSTKLFWTVGFCGGFTTFSTFSMETLRLLEHGHMTIAITYTVSSVVFGIAAAWVGYRISL